MYCGLSTASEVFIIFTTYLYHYFSVLFLFAPFSDESSVFLPKYSQTAILHAAHFLRVVNSVAKRAPTILHSYEPNTLKIIAFTNMNQIDCCDLLILAGSN